jgi:hypothetical protein
VSKTLVGPPPENTLSSSPHKRETLVLVSGLPVSVTDAQIKRECIESLGRPRFIYMHVSDARTGLFSGTCVIEFQDSESATKTCQTGLLSRQARPITSEEFESLTSGDWPMLEYGPAKGCFSTKSRPDAVAPPPTAKQAPTWAQPNRPPVSNPWQR